jgi:(R,R)-butanediol dehydrogenase/meso-butanediol dehydrogenase/diacetyl reductase
MKTMMAARYLGPERLEALEIPAPTPGEGEALIAVEACGFCGTDLSIVGGTHPRAKAPLTLGHEICGRIVEIASNESGLAVGDCVVVYPLIVCGECYACTHDNAHVCRSLRLFGIDVDGGMAEYVKLPVSSLMKLPAGIPARIGALIEPLAVAVHGVSQASLEGVELAVVMGAGPIGLMTALVAKARGVPRVLISDVRLSRLELAASIGLHAVAAGDELRSVVMAFSKQNGADLVFECTGAPAAGREMTALTRSKGTIVNLGVFKKPVEIDMQAINFKEIQVLGSRVYRREDFEVAIELAMRLPLQRIVTQTFALHEVATAFQRFQAGEVCKALILPQ